MTYKLEPATKQNLLQLKRYKKETIFAYAKNLSLEELEKINKYIEETTENKLPFYKLIILNKKCIGCLLLTENQKGKMLEELYIEKEYRHKGIGTSILKEITTAYPIVFLYVYKENKEAISLYQKNNFQIIEETETRYLMEYNQNK